MSIGRDVAMGRLFDDGAEAALHFESVVGTTTGVVIAGYRSRE